MKYWNKASLAAFAPIVALLFTVLMVAPTPVGAQVTVPREQCFQVVGFFTGPEATLNPLSPSMGIGYQNPDVYECLAYPDPIAGGLKPWLAESWEWVDDHALRIKIRPEAHFRKGQPVTAEDVKFSLETLGNPNISGVIAGLYEMVESIEVVDQKTLLLHTKPEVIPRSNLVLNIMIPPARIVNKEQWSALLDQYGANILQYTNLEPDEMNGSGPYTLLSNTAATLIWVRVDDYWGNQIGWYFAPKYYTYVYCGSYDAAIRAGIYDKRGDVIHDLGGRDLKFLVDHRNDLSLWNPEGPTAEWQNYEPNDFGCILNITKPIFREQWFRYAVAYALNYHKLLDVIAVCQVGCVPPVAWLSVTSVDQRYLTIAEEIMVQYFETENDHDLGGYVHIKYDPEKAVEILSEHCTGSVEEGWTWNGEKIGPFEVMGFLEVPPITNFGEVIAANMRAIGIEAQVVTPPFPERWTNIMNWEHYDLGWCMNLAGPPNPVAVALNNAFVAPRTTPFGGSQCEYQKYWSGEYPPLEDTADEVAALVQRLWNIPEGTQESFDIVRQIYEIVIPQLPMIPVYQNMSPVMSTTFNWANWTRKDDPLDYATYNVVGSWFNAARHVYPKLVDTVSVTISPTTVRPGQAATITVTLRNNGTASQLYPIKVHNGPAAPGEYLNEPEKLVAHKAVEVPAGQTVTATLQVSFDQPGTYTLTVDDWRYSKWDLGEPVELTLTVTTATATPTVTPTRTPTPTPTATPTPTPAPTEVWTWIAVGIVIVVIIAIIAVLLMRMRKK